MMTDLLDDFKTENAVFKESAVWAGALFGGPFAGAYLLAHNFKRFEMDNKVKMTWLLASAAGFITVLFIFFVPFIGVYGLYVGPFLYSAIAYIAVENLLERKMIDHHKSHGKYESAGKVAVVSIIGFLSFGLPIVVLFIFSLTT